MVLFMVTAHNEFAEVVKELSIQQLLLRVAVLLKHGVDLI